MRVYSFWGNGAYTWHILCNLSKTYQESLIYEIHVTAVFCCIFSSLYLNEKVSFSLIFRLLEFKVGKLFLTTFMICYK